MKYDIVIPIAPKDYNKATYCIRSILQYVVPQPKHIYIISPLHNATYTIDNTIIINVHEQEVMPLNPTACTKFKRSRWIYAMFIKMFQDVSIHDDYLVIDSDLVFLRQFNVFDNDKRQFFLGINQNHKPYFNFMERFLGFGREYDHSFISELMLFNKNISREIANIVGGVKNLYDICTKYATNECIPADYEIYGNYVYKNYPEIYKLKKIKMSLNGKYTQWTDIEIRNLIKEKQQQDFDTLTYHTWI